MTEIRERVTKNHVRFKMYGEIAEETDCIEDPSIAFPEGRKKILLGYVVIETVTSNTPDEDKTLYFTPDNIPDGIETANPMLNFRSRAYPISVKERQ
jgi:catalase